MTVSAGELREEVRRRHAESARAPTDGTGGRSGGGAGAGPKLGESVYGAERRGEPHEPVPEPGARGKAILAQIAANSPGRCC